MKNRIFLLALLLSFCSIKVLAEEIKHTELPKINVIFLDHSTILSKDRGIVVRNDWSTWERRLPHFIPALNDVAIFKKGEPGEYQNKANLFSILLSEQLTEEKQLKFLTNELKEIFNITQRPSCILARSTNGHDQLSMVFQDNRDYPPKTAAEIVLQLSKFSPPGRTVLWPQARGPFQPPPTVIMDYRSIATEINSRNRNLCTQERWDVLESGYLLPEYVLHAIAVINDSILKETGTFYQKSKPDVGTGLLLRASTRKGAYSELRSHYGDAPPAAGHMILDEIKHVDLSPEGRIKSVTIRTGIGPWAGIEKKLSGREAAIRYSQPRKGIAFFGPDAYKLTATSELKLKSLDHHDIPDTYKAGVWTVKSFDIKKAGRFPLPLPTSFEREDRTFFTKAGGILFEVGNDYKEDSTGTVKLYEKLAKNAKDGEFDVDGEKFRVVSIPLGKPSKPEPMEVGWCKLIEVDMLDTSLGHLPLALPRFYRSASGDKNKRDLGQDWSIEFAKIIFDAGSKVSVEIDEEEYKLAYEVIFEEQETGVKLLYDLSLGATITESSDGPRVHYGPSQSYFQPDLFVRQNGSFVVALKHGTTIVFNADGYPIMVKDRSGRAIQFNRQDNQIQRLVASNGKKFDFHYNKNSRLVKIDDGKTPFASYKYEDGLLSNVNTSSCNKYYEYNSEKHITRISGDGYDDGPITISYDDTHRIKELSIGEKTKKITYDDQDHDITLIREDGSTIQWEFDPNGHLQSIFHDPYVVLLSWDYHGRILQMAQGTRKETHEGKVTRITKVLGARVR